MNYIYDTSNSNKRPTPRGLGGPLENDIVRYLKQYCKLFNFEFTDDLNKADIVFTNDVFPLNEYNKPLIKRMDGVYSQINLMERNVLLNSSASMSSHVIFISEFSKKSLEYLYPSIFNNVKNYSIINNAVDNKEFYPINKNNPKLSFISSSNDWNRPEKRGLELLKLAILKKEYIFYFIGNPPSFEFLQTHLQAYTLPDNIEFLGYFDNYQYMNLCYNKADAFIYLGFNDACPKTVCQAMNCHLPLFLTNSGGNTEMANTCALYLDDPGGPVKFVDVPKLDEHLISEKFDEFITNFNHYKHLINNFDSKENFFYMLENYFKVFKMYC